MKYLEAKAIAATFPKELGFVNRAALQASEAVGELECMPGVGFCHYHHRRDSQTTIYELAVLKKCQGQGWGRLLFYKVLCSAIEQGKSCIVAKCPEGNLSNGFYEHLGFRIVGVEPGKIRRLNRWQYDIKLPLLFYCADGGRNKYSEIASKSGWMLGLRSDQPKTPQHCSMVDNHWTGYDHSKHLAAVQHHKPLIATARDIEHPDQLPSILEQAEELTQYAGRVLLIPKCKVSLPLAYWLAYSVPTRYGGTSVECGWFNQRPTHLLGGSPDAQAHYAKHLNAVSLDGNYAMNVARYGEACWQGNRIKPPGTSCYEVFEISLRKQKAYWHPDKVWRWEDEPLFSL